MEKVLEQVRQFAIQAHGDQRRKFADEPYVAHLERVMHTCRDYLPQIEVLVAALLHDVLEDTAVRKEQIRVFLEPYLSPKEISRILFLVEELTDVYTHDRYPSWNRRKRKTKEAERIAQTSAEAQTIKYADIIDNGRDILNAEPEFAWKFLHECRQLIRVMPKGQRELYQIARNTVEKQLQIAQVPGRQHS